MEDQSRAIALCSLRRTSSAFFASSGFPIACIEATGSIAATSIYPEPTSCTITLQGSMVPTLSSSFKASNARFGLQAPRIV